MTARRAALILAATPGAAAAALAVAVARLPPAYESIGARP